MYPKIVTNQKWYSDFLCLHQKIQNEYKRIEDEKDKKLWAPFKTKNKEALDKLDQK